MSLVFACLLAYFIGSIPLVQTSILYSDSAAFRAYPMRDVFGTLILHMIKGAFAVIIAWIIGGMLAANLAVIFVVLGECCPCFSIRVARNGWAVAAGALLVVSPIIMIITLLIYLLCFLVTRTFFLSFLFAIIAFLIGLIVLAAQIYLWILVICLFSMLVVHRPNWFRRRLKILRWRK